METPILGDFGAGAVLITYGVVLGKVSPFQMLIACVLEIVFFALNETIAVEMEIADIGGSMVIHMFGAFFGLAMSRMLFNGKAADHSNNNSVYHSDLFAMIGTIFLWMFWPSFNGALAGDRQEITAINTVLSISASNLGYDFVKDYRRTLKL
jgi:ammonium transporter Rh